jgi:hypothetical protein
MWLGMKALDHFIAEGDIILKNVTCFLFKDFFVWEWVAEIHLDIFQKKCITLFFCYQYNMTNLLIITIQMNLRD